MRRGSLIPGIPGVLLVLAVAATPTRAEDLPKDLSDAVSSQLLRWWKLPPEGQRTRVELTWSLNRDGSLVTRPKALNWGETPAFGASLQAAERAVGRASPFSLPAEKYETWKTIDWVFDPVDLDPALTDREKYTRKVGEVLDQSGQAAPHGVHGGKVGVMFGLATDGSVKFVKVNKSSGFPKLDKFAVLVFGKIKFPTAPPGTTEDALKFTVSLDFPTPKTVPVQTAGLDRSTLASAQRSLPYIGGQSAFQRPPGITRSALNDEFARAVIRALQKTMPALSDVVGRTKVRILLSESGLLVNLTIVSGSKNPDLDRQVLIAARQASYPLPPLGSNILDRTFTVSYIYD